MSITMNDVMGARLGNLEESDILKVNFKKTINTRQYESEVMEVETTLRVPNNITGAERMLMLAVLQAQAEYDIYCMLIYKEQITKQEFAKRKSELEVAVNAMKDKAESITGKSMEHIISNNQ